MDDIARAKASLEGDIFDWNEEFIRLCGHHPSNIMNIVKFHDPELALSSLDKLRMLPVNSEWSAQLGDNDEFFLHAVLAGSNIDIPPDPLIVTLKDVLRESRSRPYLEVTLRPNKIRPKRTAMPTSSKRAARKVLVIDDSNLILRIVSRILIDDGNSVDFELTAAGGLKTLKEKSFDVVIIDLSMPFMSGFKLLEAFRDSTTPEVIKSMKLIAMSGDFNETVMQQVFGAGFQAFLPKPFNLQDFHQIIDSW